MSGWLRSEKACTLFLYSAWIVVCVGIFMAFMLTPWFSQVEAIPRADLALRILAAPLGVLAAPASLVILFGMIAYCVREDKSSIGTKVLWLILFFATACFGATFYFFSVYRPRVRTTGSASSV